MRSGWTVAAHRAVHAMVALFLLEAAAVGAQPVADLESKRVAPYADTPYAIADEMLRLARVSADDYVIDLGSGDGRLVIRAVKVFGARRALGVDIDEKLVAHARARAAAEGIDDRAVFERRDLFDTDLSAATVVTVYLFPGVMGRVGTKLLAELRPGTRVVSHDFIIPGWSIERVASFHATEKADVAGRGEATLFLYRVPERRDAPRP